MTLVTKTNFTPTWRFRQPIADGIIVQFDTGSRRFGDLYIALLVIGQNAHEGIDLLAPETASFQDQEVGTGIERRIRAMASIGFSRNKGR